MDQKLTYRGNGDYLIPDIKLSYTESLKRDRFVRMAEAYFKENNTFLDNDLILEEKLFPYLKEIGETANHRMEKLMEELLKKNLVPDGSTYEFAKDTGRRNCNFRTDYSDTDPFLSRTESTKI